jgi:hypothetical protein
MIGKSAVKNSILLSRGQTQTEDLHVVYTITVRLSNLPPHYMYCSINNVTASVDPGVWTSIKIVVYLRPNDRRNQYRRRGSCGAVIIAIPSGITHDKPLTEF